MCIFIGVKREWHTNLRIGKKKLSSSTNTARQRTCQSLRYKNTHTGRNEHAEEESETQVLTCMKTHAG